MGAPLAPNEDRWCDWMTTLEAHEQVTHDQTNWTSCTAFCGGVESEAARLRPLLEQCLRKVIAAEMTFGASGITGIRLDDLLADLRRELGNEE